MVLGTSEEITEPEALETARHECVATVSLKCETIHATLDTAHSAQRFYSLTLLRRLSRHQTSVVSRSVPRVAEPNHSAARATNDRSAHTSGRGGERTEVLALRIRITIRVLSRASQLATDLRARHLSHEGVQSAVPFRHRPTTTAATSRRLTIVAKTHVAFDRTAVLTGSHPIACAVSDREAYNEPN